MSPFPPRSACCLMTGLLLMQVAGTACAAEESDRSMAEIASLLSREWQLGEQRSPGTRYYTLDNRNIEIDSDGSRGEPTTFRLWVEVRARQEDPDGPLSIRCVCRRATITTGDEVSRRIPSFQDYGYDLHLGVDREEQLFGIPHQDFSDLVDDAGEPLDLMEGFQLYGSFVDFHMFDTFTATGEDGFDSNLSSVRRIGQHESTEVGMEVPIHLEPSVLEGSTFRNGTTSLAFQGVTLADGKPCALIEIGSSDGSFELILAPRPGVRMTATGGASYNGELFLEFESHWMNRLEFREFVVSKISMGPMSIGNSITERLVRIRAVNRESFESALR